MSTTSRNDDTAAQNAARCDTRQVYKRKGKEVADDDDEIDEPETEDINMSSEDIEYAAFEVSQEGSQGLTADVQKKLDEMQANVCAMA